MSPSPADTHVREHETAVCHLLSAPLCNVTDGLGSCRVGLCPGVHVAAVRTAVCICGLRISGKRYFTSTMHMEMTRYNLALERVRPPRKILGERMTFLMTRPGSVSCICPYW